LSTIEFQLVWFHSFQLDDFYSPPEPRGLFLKGPIWSPHRLCLNLTSLAFMLLVPVLYGAIYWARRAQALTALGRLHITSVLSRAGISDTERARRKESNSISTTIHFIAWLIEVRWTSGSPKRHPSPAGRHYFPGAPHQSAQKHQFSGTLVATAP
jgi:hypothetical protein